MRILHWAGWTAGESRLAALLGAAVFLVHPLQSESVSYVAGRSESLAALFVLAAYAIFLYRRSAEISWLESSAVLLLFAMGVATKENAAALAGLLVLTDLFWAPGGWRAQLLRNRRLYALMLPCGLAAIVAIFRVLSESRSAGFSTAGVTWYQYGLTQARAIFVYIRLFLLPVGQSADHDFAFSRSITDHGAIFFVLALGALIGAALAWRRRFPLETFGLFWFLILLAPTSSIVPLLDPFVERRMYLPLMGLILIGAGLMHRWRPRRAVSAAVIGSFILCNIALCYRRNELWGDPGRLWIETVESWPRKWRPYVNLAETLMGEHRCPEALPYLERAQMVLPDNPFVEESRARVLECLGRRAEALDWLKRAAALDRHARVFEWIGLLHGEMGQIDEAGSALRHAVELEPKSVSAHDALGLWYESVGQPNAALGEYRFSESVDVNDPTSKAAIIRLGAVPAPAPKR